MVHHELVLMPGDKLTVEMAGGPAVAPVLGRRNAVRMGNEPAPPALGRANAVEMLDEQNGGKKKRKNTTRKNQAGGKRGPNGYMRFAGKMRKQIQEENPGADIVQVARKTGEAWRKLSDDEKAKY